MFQKIQSSPFHQLGFADTDGHWADSVFEQMTLDERIGQLFMIAAYSNKGSEHKNATMKLVKDYHIGGLIFSWSIETSKINQ